MGGDEASTEMVGLPAAGGDAQSGRRSGRAQKPPSYLKDFVHELGHELV